MRPPQADFKSLKQRIRIDHVLARYGVKLRSAGPHTLCGSCPLPTHTSRKSRQSFSVNLSLQVWSCHSASCIAARGGRMGGHVIDLVAIMERCGLRQAGLRLQDCFSAGASHPAQVRTAMAPSAAAQPNRPLGFALRGIDTRHPYLAYRGISPATARLFGVGMYRGTGFLTGRCVIPIRDEKSRLVAYAGRAIHGEEPKYRFPAGFKKISGAVQPPSCNTDQLPQRDRRGRLFRCAEGSSSRTSVRGCPDGSFFLSTPVRPSAVPLPQRHVNARWRRHWPSCRRSHCTVTEVEGSCPPSRTAQRCATGPTIVSGD
jgi:hypothetical protein